MRATLLWLTAVVAMSVMVSRVGAQGSAFQYQGQLSQGGVPADGAFDLRVVLFDAESGGNPVGPTNSNLGVKVTGGVLTTLLNFGTSAFDGSARWLELAVRPAGVGSYTVLAPRQAITPTPYAMFAPTPAGPAGPPGPPGPVGPQGPAGSGGGEPGLHWLGEWDAGRVYGATDAVFFDGSSWIAKAANSASKPGGDPLTWEGRPAAPGHRQPSGASPPDEHDA